MHFRNITSKINPMIPKPNKLLKLIFDLANYAKVTHMQLCPALRQTNNRVQFGRISLITFCVITRKPNSLTLACDTPCELGQGQQYPNTLSPDKEE